MMPAMTMGWLESNLPWQNALVVIPLALGVAAICRVTPCRPATRHMLWLVVLAVLAASPLLPALWAPPAAGEAPVPERLASADPVRLPAPAALSRPRVFAIEPPAFDRASAVIPLTSASPATPHRRLGPPAFPTTAEPSGPEAAPAFERRIGQPPTAVIGASMATDPVDPGLPAARDLTAAQVPDTGSRLRRQWRHWVAKLNVVREAVLDLPPMPLAVWAGGIVVLLLIGARRISR